MMQRQPIQSSNLKSAGFDADSGTLEVEFHSGVRHRYFGVKPETFDEFMAAESKGGYFAKNIRNNYSSARVVEDDSEPLPPAA